MVNDEGSEMQAARLDARLPFGGAAPRGGTVRYVADAVVPCTGGAVVLRPGASLSAEAIQQHCKGLIAGYKCPRSIEFRSAIPVSPAGKMLKYQLREPFWAGQTRRVH